jgi:hypothetical protein
MLRSFLIQQAVALKQGETAMSFGKLNRLRRAWSETGGRSPTLEEWEELERNTQDLYSHLNESLRRRFLYGQIPTWVAATAAALGVLSLLAMFGAFRYIPEISLVLPFYMLWLASLGAVGSIAFIGMNALAVQEDATFDLTNHRLIILRITLGALFGVVLTLPFGFKDFLDFVGDLRSGNVNTTGVATQSILLLLPFILGFSTPLVIMILNQFVEAVQSFFGKKTVVVQSSDAKSAEPDPKVFVPNPQPVIPEFVDPRPKAAATVVATDPKAAPI